jgi:phage terminase large subunit-like protein
LSGRSDKNWTAWKIKLAQAVKNNPRLTVGQFCSDNGLNYETAKKYLRKDDCRVVLKNFEHDLQTIETFCDKLRSVQSTDDAKRYLKALHQSLLVTEDVMMEAMREFKKGILLGDGITPTDAGKLALDASDRLRKLALELQGLPSDDEDFGWPLTKGFWPHWYQRDFIFDFPSTLRAQGKECFIQAFIGGIRSGKTYCGAQKLGELAWRNRGCTLAVYAPTYRMLEDSTKATVLDALQRKRIGYTYRKTDNSILLFGDTLILFRSMDDPEHLRGTTLAGAWIDEGGQMPTDEAFKIIQGRISDPVASEPMLMITTTPDGLGWLYNKLVEEPEKHKVIVYQAKTQWNSALPDGYFDRLQGSFDERYAKQELGGEWIDVFAGQAYWNFQRTVHVLRGEQVPYDKTLPLILCFDLNVDPMCWNVVQCYTEGAIRKSNIIDEIHIRSASTEQAAKEFVRRYPAHKAGVIVYGDATCRHRSTRTTRTDYDIVVAALQQAGLPNVQFRIGTHNPLITDRVAAVNAQLMDLKGNVKLYMHHKCTYTIRDFERVSFKSGTRQLEKSDPALTHHTDAVGYYIAKEFPVRGVQVAM